MNASSDSTKRGTTRNRIVLAVLAFLTLWGFGTTAYFWNDNLNMTAGLDQGKLTNERLLGEKLQLEKQIVDLAERLQREHEEVGEGELKVEDLQRRVEAAMAHSRSLEGAARRGRELASEVATLREAKRQLELQLALAGTNELDLREQVGKANQQRDELAAQLEEQRAGTRMVNNAEVDALRGKKSKITVVARRAQEIRMAFDLPQNLAQGASFKIIAPDGKDYSGADPSISMTIDTPEPEPMASIDMMPTAMVNDRAARVHLKFAPAKKLLPGTYRIDVISGGVYLNTVLLNLR